MEEEEEMIFFTDPTRFITDPDFCYQEFARREEDHFQVFRVQVRIRHLYLYQWAGGVVSTDGGTTCFWLGRCNISPQTFCSVSQNIALDAHYVPHDLKLLAVYKSTGQEPN